MTSALITGRVVVLENLKKCRRGVYHVVPMPPELLDTLDFVHSLRAAQPGQGPALALEPHDSFRWVSGAAGILAGPHACSKGLPHGFGVKAVSKRITLTMVQKWLAHAQLTSTAIYANAVGEEEQSIAARMR